MQKNDEREGTVISVGMNGEGVLKDDGKVVFVPFSLPGEKIRYKVLKVDGNVAYGKILEVCTPAEDRVRPKCPVFGKCGGCQLQHVKYPDQLKIKQEKVKTCFSKIAFSELEINPCVKSKNEYRYRNKLQLPVSVDAFGNTITGFYADNSHRIVPIEDCPINAPWTADAIKAFKEYFKIAGVCGYDEKTGRGDIREITVKDVKGSLIFTVVSVKDELKNADIFIDILKKHFTCEFSLFFNVNKSTGNVIYGEKFKLLYGSKTFSSDMLGVKYAAGVKSFMQVNDYVCAKLYGTVCDLACADENTVVIDAYSGAGLMTAMLAKRAKKAIGIEIEPEAVRLANELALNNGLSQKISNYLGKCEEIMPDIIKKEVLDGDKTVLVLDPPRKGCDLKVIDAVIRSGIEKIIYVSCKPSTLARDVGLITGTLEWGENGVKKVENPILRYRVDSVTPFDMFSQTKHVETVVSLTKNKVTLITKEQV